MTNQDINSILVVLLILLATMALAFWLSPRGCRWLSLYLYCRATALDAARQAFEDTMQANQPHASAWRCPNCDRLTTFTPHVASSTEPHGEQFNDEWVTCDMCGARTEAAEIESVNSHLTAARLAA